MPDLGRIDPEVMERGSQACVFYAESEAAERWSRAVGRLSGQRVDWCYSAGKAHLLYIGSYRKVRRAALDLAPDHGVRIFWFLPKDTNPAAVSQPTRSWSRTRAILALLWILLLRSRLGHLLFRR